MRDRLLRKETRANMYRVFDWDKAARIIREQGLQEAGAGLAADWRSTGGIILENGLPVKEEDTYTYLASSGATPVLRRNTELGYEDIPCFLVPEELEDNDHRKSWGPSTYWPDSALAIIKADET